MCRWPADSPRIVCARAGTPPTTPVLTVRPACTPQEEHPCALHSFDQIAALAAGKLVSVFLDYDGALCCTARLLVVGAGAWQHALMCCSRAAQPHNRPWLRQRPARRPGPAAAGTLTPIVSNPDLALMSEQAREAVRHVAQLFPTAIISGRGREKVQQFVRLDELYYAGSHGMDIVGPAVEGSPHADLAFQPAAQYESLMDGVYQVRG